MEVDKKTADRFWAKVEKTDGCWLWRGCIQSQGYGNFWVAGKYWRAHRFSYALAHGSIDPALYLCHRCDTPNCVNPEHLWLGTQSDNMGDASAKGHCDGNPRLSRKQVRAIRSMSTVMMQREVAIRFQISEGHVSQIIHGGRWGGRNRGR